MTEPTTDSLVIEMRRARSRQEAAEVYARGLLLGPQAALDWPVINGAILERWSVSSLKTVKFLAWKIAKAGGAPS